MTTLTQMERTATGWKCPRCGSTQEDTILPVRVMECNCAGIDPFRHGLSVVLTKEQLRERYPRHARAEKADGDVEPEPFETWANTTHPRKP